MRLWSASCSESHFSSATAVAWKRDLLRGLLSEHSVAAPALALRPQLIAMALFSLTLLFVVERHEHPRRLWLVPFIAIAWANVHGSFFLAPAVLGLAWLSDMEQRVEDRHLALLVGVVTVLVCCVTPFGPECLDVRGGPQRKS